MAEWMKNILSDHADGFVLLEQLPFSTCISDHALHHIVNRNEIGKKAMAFALFDWLQF